MSALAVPTSAEPTPRASASPGSLSPADLAELMAAFNEVTAKLEQTHAQLRAEVRRLSTELRDANEALQRSKRLAALGEMAAGIAHEVRNPLGSIGLYARMLEEDLSDRPACRGVAVKIAAAVRGLDAVVGDVLTFSRELRLRAAPADAREVLDRAIDACLAELGEVIREESGETPAEFECDAGLLHQALVNVLRNAGEANRAVGRSVVRVGASPGVLDPADPDPVDAVVLRVRDEGDGVTREVVERMFNPFFTTRAAGTGLGLPIVHRIVDAHAGRVVVMNNSDSEPGAPGATVELRLPLRAARPSAEVVVRRGVGLVAEGSR
jgi:signal transduction histidine kinase